MAIASGSKFKNRDYETYQSFSVNIFMLTILTSKKGWCNSENSSINLLSKTIPKKMFLKPQVSRDLIFPNANHGNSRSLMMDIIVTPSGDFVKKKMGGPVFPLNPTGYLRKVPSSAGVAGASKILQTDHL
jgi:hypothetical protein